MKKAAKFIVIGTVQGVFFRNFCKEKAEELKLTGHVRNLEDGNVEVYVEGEKDNITKLGNLLKEGPKYAQIKDLKFEEKKWTGEFKEFKIIKF